jgi:signal transduction histidine kinase
MRRRSFFLKTFSAFALLIVLTLCTVIVLFFYQFNRYTVAEKQLQLQDTLENVTEQTVVALSSGSADLERLYQLGLIRIAKKDDLTILVTDLYGNITFWVNADGFSRGQSLTISADAVRSTRTTGSYSAVGTLGALEDTSYLLGTVASNGDNVLALVYVAFPTHLMNELLQEISRSFLFICILCLLAVLVISYILSMHITRPLKTMVTAAHEYAAGNFSMRVPVDGDCDEIDGLAASFNNMAGDLEQLDELTRGFIGNVSHEFKTPMTTIGGFVDGMLDGTIPQDQWVKYLNIIAEEVRRLSRMVTKMLEAAKIQSGELILTPAPFDFTDMTSQILLSFEQPINQKHLRVEADLADRLIVQGDRDNVFRAVYNLLDNAVKFIDVGGTLTLRAYAEGNNCCFSVKNTGAGIEPDDIPHVFDRFFKTDRSRSRDKTGAGLGLYLVKSIINLHGGDISVRSDGGETEFSFTLPLAERRRPSAP